MISLGLSSADQKLFEQSLYTGYNLRIVVQILDLNHNYITDVSSMLIDGQVNYSYWEPISYAASMTLLDPDNRVGFDSSSPADNALYNDRMIRIVYSIYSELLPRWVDVPIFCGPVTKVKRDDAILSVECQGKESLVSNPTIFWSAKTYAKGRRGADAIRDLMSSLGETKFELANLTYTLGRDYSIWSESEPWEFANSLAASKSYRHLWYDGRGVLRLRERPTRPIWTFTESMLLTVPRLDYNHTDIRNAVLVKGATPEGKTAPLQAVRYLAGRASPQALGRNNKSRIMMDIFEDSTLATQAAVNTAADKRILMVENTNVGFEFDSFPIPHLEPGDLFHLSTRDVSIVLQMDQYSIPLKPGPQSNGTIRKVSANHARLRSR